MTNKTMTMADAGPVQLEEQVRWGYVHQECSASTDSRTDDDIRLALIAAGIDPNDYETEFSVDDFREAVRTGMDKWFAAYQYGEFILGFAEAAGMEGEEAEADTQWAAYSRQLPEREREDLEHQGYDAGVSEGGKYRRDFPKGDAE